MIAYVNLNNLFNTSNWSHTDQCKNIGNKRKIEWMNDEEKF